jgi:GNAT superfamily N-acetyltransferase
MRFLQRIRKIGLAAIGSRLARQLWSETAYLELTVDVANLPDAQAGGKRAPMIATDALEFRGFEAELETSTGTGYLEVLNLDMYCRAGMAGLYVAWSEERKPMYAQWALWPEDRATMPRFVSSIYPYPDPGEVLIEGAYTFRAFRRRGLMKSCMRDLLELCRNRGATGAVTLVIAGNVPAIRACAACGFSPMAVRLRRRRFGYRSVRRVPMTPRWSKAWADATVAATGDRGVQ